MRLGANVDKMAVCGFGYLAFFFAYNTLQNLTTQLFEQLGFSTLGFYVLAVVYITMCASSLFCGSIVARFGTKKLLVCSVSLECSIVAAYLLPGFCANLDSSSIACSYLSVAAVFLLASVCMGVGAGIMWIAQGKYLADCARRENNADVLQGVFWLLFQLSQVLENLFAALVLTSKTAQMAFFCGLLLVAVGAVGMLIM